MGARDPSLPWGGASLRQERLRRRLSLIEVGERTRIPPRILEAIEADDARALPAPVYAVGLITSYARFLGIDPAPIVAAYRARLSRSEAIGRSGRLAVPRTRVALPGIALPSVLVGLVVVLGIYLYQQYAQYVSGAALLRARPVAAASIPPTPRTTQDLPLEPPTSTPPPSPTPSPAMAQSAAATTPVGAVTPNAPPPTPTPAPPPPTATATPVREVKIDATASARVWVQVQADSKVIFSGILNAGDQKTWIAQKSLMIWAGNAASVTVTFNGKPLGTLGRPGEVVKVTWTAPP